MTVEPRWERVERPILEALAAADGRPLTGTELEEATGLETSVLMRSLRSLKEDAYVAGALMTVGEEDYPAAADSIRLTPKGLREVGIWPSTDVAAALIAALEELVANEPDADKRAKGDRAVKALKAFGTIALNAAISQAVGAGVSHL
jgi:hypothetical protein